MDYPKRPKFFACRFVRVLTKACIANDLGADACWLLSLIAMTEDAKGYRGPVVYFNEQLMPLAGAANVKALVRIRARAVSAGWLIYHPGGKRTPGRYWVQIPELHRDWDDAPTDEECDPLPVSNSTQEVGVEAGDKRVENRDTSGQRSGIQVGNSSSLFLNLDLPLSQDPPTPVPGDGVATETKPKRNRKAASEDEPRFARFWASYPRKVKKPQAATAFAKIAPDDALLDVMLRAIEKQRRTDDWIRESGKFIPHPTSWLNARRWEDAEPEIVKDQRDKPFHYVDPGPQPPNPNKIITPEART